MIKETKLYADDVFAPLDADLHMERIAGGNETEVYATDDHRFVVKIKSELGGGLRQALEHAKQMRDAADQFAACIGPKHSIASSYILSRDSAGHIQVLVLQPFIRHAHPLYAIDYNKLGSEEREQVALQLRDIIRRALVFYRNTQSMPDLYGRSSTNKDERKRLNSPYMLPYRLWSFLIKRNLLRSHNLLLTNSPECRLVLVDYDFVRRGWLYRRIYYTVRWLLFWRDHALIAHMQRGGAVPRA
jgi:hypothetical protein